MILHGEDVCWIPVRLIAGKLAANKTHFAEAAKNRMNIISIALKQYLL